MKIINKRRERGDMKAVYTLKKVLDVLDKNYLLVKMIEEEENTKG